jgi:hypothetical protein
MKPLLALVLALVLAACVTKQDEVANDESACIAKGVMPSDPGFNKCMVDSDLKAQKEMGEEMDSQEMQDAALMACCW